MTQKHFHIIGGLILALAIFLRFFNLGDWIHYELDQARDYRIIQAAIEYGPGELPLQGPKAAGNVVIPDENGELTDKTTLRLGPLFYYIEYVSVLIFGDSPVGSIVLITIFSTLTVPLFYVFARRFFGVPLALGLSAIMASGLFFVTYSRFGWNPNLMPFFMLLLGYSLLRATDPETPTRIGKYALHRGWWLVLAAVALAFVGHMHFLAFTAAPVIAVAYLVWSWRQVVGTQGIALKFWLMAVAVFAFLQTPLVLNDMQTGGENTKAFIAALTQKTEDEDAKSLPEKFARNTHNHAKYYWLVVTGDQRAELPVLRGSDIQCDHTCREGLARGGVAALAMLAGLIAWIALYMREKDLARKQFLRLAILWTAIVFVVYLPLAYDMAPRFFLLHSVMMLVFLGLVIHAGFVRGKKVDYVLGWMIVGLAIASNLMYVAEDFSQRARAATDATLRIETDHVMKEKTRMTFAQMTQIVDHMLARAEETGYPIWIYAQPEFKRAFWERIDTSPVDRFGASNDLTGVYRNGLYFVIVRSQSDQAGYLDDILPNADLVDYHVFGTLTLYEFVPHEDVIVAESPTIDPPERDPKFSSSAQKRYLWRQVLTPAETIEIIVPADGEEEE